MKKLYFASMTAVISLLLAACTPGPMGTKRYQPYGGSDAALIYTQVNERHSGLYYLQRFVKDGECYKDAELIYISNNFMDGSTNRLIESRIQPEQYWSLYVMDNSSGRQMLTQTAFVPEAGKHYIAIDYKGVVEIPKDLQPSASDNLEQIYDKYQDKPARTWNIRDGRCKFWFAKLMGG